MRPKFERVGGHTAVWPTAVSQLFLQQMKARQIVKCLSAGALIDAASVLGIVPLTEKRWRVTHSHAYSS